MFRFKTLVQFSIAVISIVLSSLVLDEARLTLARDKGGSSPVFVSPRFAEPKDKEDQENEAPESVDSTNDSVDVDLPNDDATDPSASSESSSTTVEVEEPDEPPQDAASNEDALENVTALDDDSYDVYKENGHYFVDWEKPELALVFTGLTNGYIEPCGCAGMARMKGGLSRRATFLKELRETRDWNVVAIDTGQITVGFGVQEELKFDMAMNAYKMMEYDAVGIGKGELRFPASFLLTFTAPTSSTDESLYVSSNVGVYGYHPTYTLPYKVIERGGKKIGVTSVVFGDETTKSRDNNILLEDPEKKLQSAASALEKEGCDICVLIVHGSEQESLRLAKTFPIFNYVLTSDSASEPPSELQSIGKDQSLIEVGEKGKYAVVLGLYPDGQARYQRVALDSRYESNPDITLLMKDYQSILKVKITTEGFRAGLGINPARSPQSEILGKYVGSQKCRSCHEEPYRVWIKSDHASAWKSLKETANPPRDFDPECISCHVVGWNSLQHLPYVDGYSSERKTPELENVGCESCHGQGEFHIAAEVGSDEKLQERLRAAMRLGDNVKKVCYQCHDGDNSPAFEFDKYYPLIEHVDEDSLEDE